MPSYSIEQKLLRIMRAAHWVVTILILLLGVIHSGMTFTCMELNEDALWFLGSGIAIVLSGGFNLLALTSQIRQTRAAAIAVNCIMAAMFLLSLSVLRDAQVYIGITLFAFAAVLTWRNTRTL